MAYNSVAPLENLFVFDIETIPDVSLASELCNGMLKNPANEMDGRYTKDEIEKMSVFEKEDLMTRYHLEQHKNDFLRQPFHKISCISYLIAGIEYDDFGKEKYVFKKLESCSCFEDVKEEKSVEDLMAALGEYLVFSKEMPARAIVNIGAEYQLDRLSFGFNVLVYIRRSLQVLILQKKRKKDPFYKDFAI